MKKDIKVIFTNELDVSVLDNTFYLAILERIKNLVKTK